MRIAQLANFVSEHSGGIRVALEALGCGYVEAGHHRLLVIPGDRDLVMEDGRNTVAMVKSPRVGGTYRIIVNLGKVRAVLNRFAPTSLEFSDKWTLARLSGWARKLDIATVLISHERLDDMASDFTGIDLVRGLVHLRNRQLASMFDQIVVTSDYSAGEWSHTKAKLAKVVLGVDLDEFRPNPSEDGYSPKETIRACYVGRMSHEKYPQLAVATLIELHRRGVPIELHMYGTGPDVEALKRQGDGYPVIFHGFVDGRAAVAQCYRESDLTFSMCPTETFGLAPLESLACGTPAVVVNGSGASETVDHSSGESAQADPCSLAEAVTRLISRLSPQLRRAARARAEHFPWSASVEKMLEIHQRLTESR